MAVAFAPAGFGVCEIRKFISSGKRMRGDDSIRFIILRSNF
jgi:hypothetical protein